MVKTKMEGIGSLYYRLATKLSVLLFDQIITDCLEMQKIYLKKYKRNSTLISYGSTMTKKIEKGVMRKYKITSKNYYLIVGRLIPDNNSDLIVEGLLMSKSNKRLVVVGDVPYSDNFSKKLKSKRHQIE